MRQRPGRRAVYQPGHGEDAREQGDVEARSAGSGATGRPRLRDRPRFTSGASELVEICDLRLVFVALDHFASRTDNEFGIVVGRVWQREPELSGEMRSLSKRAAATKKLAGSPRRRAGRRPVHWGSSERDRLKSATVGC